jgi:hypothetical protein
MTTLASELAADQAWSPADHRGTLKLLARELDEAVRLLAYASVRCDLALAYDADRERAREQLADS